MGQNVWRADLKAKVSLPNVTTTAGPMVVMIAGDKAKSDIYADAKPAFAEIAKLKPMWSKNYNTGSELVNLFSTGEITTSIAQDFTLAQIKAARADRHGPTSRTGPSRR